MHDSGLVDFQSHSHEHRYVPRWPEALLLEGTVIKAPRVRAESGLTIEKDLRLSKKILEEKLNKKVQHLAWPGFNGTTEAMCSGTECGYRAFWWGVLPNHPENRPGDSPGYIVRLKSDFLRRLPGEGRVSLKEVFCKRALKSIRGAVEEGTEQVER
jgi:hypothetical protein